MFSYYGSKSKIIKKYPKPEFDSICEPFAGSARYALEYWDKDVLLVDKYDVIVRIWHYLQQATEKDIDALPELERGERIPEYLCEEEKLLLGFAVNPGSQQPKNIYTTWAARDKEITRHKKRIIANLNKIRHWKVICGDYKDILNHDSERERAWFIDPPYQQMGKFYVENQIDYTHLAEWSKSLPGQVIVCENMGADWLPFIPLIEVQGQKKRSTEAIWIK